MQFDVSAAPLAPQDDPGAAEVGSALPPAESGKLDHDRHRVLGQQPLAPEALLLPD
jgi:hypothetical protein